MSFEHSPTRPARRGPTDPSAYPVPGVPPGAAAPLPPVGPPRRPRAKRSEGCGASSGDGRGWRRALGLAGLAAGGAAALVALRRLGRDTPPLYRSLRATPRELSWSGFRVVSYTAGPEDAAPVVLVHGIHAAASAWEMRELFSRLAEGGHRVIAYDLLGFGASDRPDVDYDADLYQDLLRSVLDELAGAPADVVASSLSAAHALGLAAAEPERFRSLTLINPTGLLTQAESQRSRGRWLQAALRAPWLGEALFNLLVSRPSLRHFTGKLYGDGADPLAAEVAAQGYATAHQPGARYAPAAFLGDALAANVYMALRTLEVPALAVWSRSGLQRTERESDAFAGVAPGVGQVWIEDSGALPHEERPAEVVERLEGWWQTLG